MWTEENNKLNRTFKFKNFIDAFTFMTKVAFIAEKMNHHPYLTNIYNEVTISLSTHDEGDIITIKDRNLASEIDKIYNGNKGLLKRN